MDSLITLLIFAALAVGSAWLKKRQNAGEESVDGETPPVPGRSRRRLPQEPADWEEQLRRMLGQEPGPVLTRTEEPPPSLSSPPLLSHVPGEGESSQGGTSAWLARAAAARQRVVDLQQQLRVASTSPPRTRQETSLLLAAPAGILVRQLLRQPDSMRAVFVGAMILGPPKALEKERNYD